MIFYFGCFQEADLLALKNFIFKKKPHVIVIGGESREAIMIKEDLSSVIGELTAQDGFPTINIEIYDNEEAKVYANSIKAQVTCTLQMFLTKRISIHIFP